MSRPLKAVALSGGTWRPSRTRVLNQALLAQLAVNKRRPTDNLRGARVMQLSI